MATHICLSLCLFYFATLTLAQSDNYIIHMDTSAMPKAFSTQHTWYQSTLSSALKNSKSTTNNLNSVLSSKLLYSYTNVINGFSANLSPKELEALKTSPGYVSFLRDLPAKRDTTHSPKFLGLNPHEGAWPAAQFGKDVIVGLVDTGIWPESESFRDEGIGAVPSRWKGQCESTIKCNRKLIGARFFNKGLLAKHPNITIGANSTRDTEGHGTHTSSTAAGSVVEGASYFGYASGSATGMASSARVAMYKALWEDGAYMSDIIAAIDGAISDGVDVLSLSFGFDDIPLYEDPVAIATFAAMQKNIFVSTSAGNEGPFLGRLHNGIPWVITVAAGTLDREFHGALTLGNGVQVTGMSLYHGNFSSGHVPIVFMGLCDRVKELAKVRSKIVVCEDNGTIIDVQVSNIYEANVVAAVFITNSSDSSFFLDNSFATIVVSTTDGEIVKAYIKSNNSSAKASMSFEMTVLDTKPAPSVDSYSSRGPSSSCPFVLKPDITAPGTSILAAWPQNLPVETFGTQNVFSNFNLLSGTSMACPHVAGVAALLRGAHPEWSVASIRSAIVTTSDMLDNTLGPIKDIGNDNKAASPLASGSGHINPNRALNPGLVYDVGVQDYVNLLCALGFTQRNITVITGTSSNDCSKPSLDLNYPSFIAFFNSNNSSTAQEFQRTVTHVGEGPASYAASFIPVEGYEVSVSPELLVFKEKYEKLSYTLRIEGPRKKKEKKVAFGYLIWTDLQHVVRSPIVVTTLKFDF
ncbi:subtilisin-like protease SBT1.9 [Vigna unguiculata]|uniref:subtilisin-like protease SBT1.9 n=1 Tax=Vigna unguiculata TaxID=3917 RepID=UPI001016ACE1|nr:subtilisin-like protease SBT1.9 [Vigna unguiculata]